MSTSRKLQTILSLVMLLSWFNVYPGDEPDQPNLRFYLSEDKSSFAGMVMVNQIWARYIQNNPDYNGVEQYGDFDMALRRSRLIFYTYLMDRVFIYTQIGTDGLTYRSAGKPEVNLYNAQTEFIAVKNKLHIGLGLNTWNGISRYSNSKLLEFLVVDNPGFAYPVAGKSSRFGRQFGVYAKGRLNDFHYQVALSKPFETGVDSVSVPVTTERLNENFAVKGYFQWQFLDNEDHLFPYMTLNNLGRKRIFNVGAGFYYHPEAMLVGAEKDLSTVDPMLAAMLEAAGSGHLIEQFAGYFTSKISDIFLGAVDLFLDMPTNRGGAVTSYLGYYYYFFGPDYLRASGKMNVSRMDPEIALLQGHGNSEWEVGTGHIVRGELGYLIPGTGFKNRLQPFGAFTAKSFEALDQASVQFDAGINWLMHGHHLKWTLQYSSRPIYTVQEGKNKWTSSKGQVILQAQIFF